MIQLSVYDTKEVEVYKVGRGGGVIVVSASWCVTLFQQLTKQTLPSIELLRLFPFHFLLLYSPCYRMHADTKQNTRTTTTNPVMYMMTENDNNVKISPMGPVVFFLLYNGEDTALSV
jgi:hypothetical protein